MPTLSLHEREHRAHHLAPAALDEAEHLELEERLQEPHAQPRGRGARLALVRVRLPGVQPQHPRG
eukprot:CAMPEP_0118876594 /NCGR_PEP_ID=MMETSP1163-20130328/17225_1 /TAXON_ID=124430 /ORGANISM="Phaeomonas parva, Strain CCMP2877" /LENGTH=64 /DNA_ID=CAMNT_0006812213 /DNA_START=220 /DNA_END=410 /DNA_ORIENTATION=-